MLPRRFLVPSVAILACLTSEPRAKAQDVAARDYFADDGRKVIYIELGSGQRLIFTDAENKLYALHGKPLEIRVDEIQVTGNVVISASIPKGAENLQKVGAGNAGGKGGQGYGDGGGGGVGGEGGKGPDGLPGGDAGASARVRVFAKRVVGEGSLTIDNSGATGGTGGEGGRGGLGGVGGHGANRDCSNGPGNGGNGGIGGIGGTGGPGGHGGNGGDIEITKPFCTLVDSKKVILVTTHGQGGAGGLGGFGGDGGAGGEGGSGGCSGGGADNRAVRLGPSRASERGATGPKGADGLDGKTKCTDCPQKTCPALRKQGQNPPKRGAASPQ